MIPNLTHLISHWSILLKYASFCVLGIQEVLKTDKKEGEEWIFLSSKDANLLRENAED
jgi:hypothetical protein